LSDPENDFPPRQEYAKLCRITIQTMYQHFTPAELQTIENEAYEVRKKNSTKQRAELLAMLYTEGMAGKVRAIREYLDRTEGKVPDKQERSGPGGGAIEHKWRIEVVEAQKC
jgi:hypothetical protein